MAGAVVLGQQRPSGELYALEMDDESVITAVCGPLTQREAADWIANDTYLNMDTENAEWANAQEWHYPTEVIVD
jgi:hypothetical protein